MPLSEDMLNHVLRGGKLFLHQKPDGATYWGNETGAAFTPTVAAASTAATVTTVKQAELGFTNLRSTGATGNRSNEPGFKAGAEIATAVKDGGLLVVTEDNMLRSVSLDRNGTIQMRDIPLQAKNLQDFQAAVDVTDSTQVGKVSKDKKGVILGHSVASAQPYPRTGPIMDVAPGDKKVTLTQEGQFAVVTTSGNNGKIIQAEVLNNSLDKHAFELMKGDPRKLDDAQKKEIAGYIKRLEQESGLKLTAPATQAAGAAPPQNAPPPRVEYKKYGPNGIVVFPAPPQPPAPAAPQPSAPPSRRPPPPAPEKSGEIRAETPTGSVTVSLAEAAPHGAAAGAKPDQVAVAKAAGGSTPSAASDTTPT
ncbi:MAG: hypothetical protein EBZ69_03490 [Alphaproteobacteria bacterium]|nr:hypothetical protein [Alphaproteobacteria bacterium]